MPDWTCRHCEHWRLGPMGPNGRSARAPTCARGAEPFWVHAPADCAHYVREPGADDELETPPAATGAAVRPSQPRGATHAQPER
jgi:hypothetical protein